MQKYFPSQVIGFLDARFPFANNEASVSVQLGVTDGGPAISHLLRMIDGIPSRLLRFAGPDEAAFGQGLAALRLATSIWASGRLDYYVTNLPFPRQPSGTHPLALVRKHLASLADDIEVPIADSLTFVSDAALRASLGRDIAGVNSALDHGEWKSATVLAGAVIEALLLDALLVEEKERTALFNTATKARASKRLGTALDRWDLHDLIEVSDELRLITKETATACDLAKDFRNLIHPGRNLRLAQVCDRATALSAVAGMEHVVRDLRG